MNENLYEMIGVNRDATKDEIKKTYKKLVRMYHPDINKGGENYFKKINYAFDILLDDNKRQEYNVTLGIQELRQATENIEKTPPYMAFYVEKTTKSKRHSHSFSTYFAYFKRKIEKKFLKKSKRGEDVYFTLEITPYEAIFGTSKRINILHKKECSKCKGQKNLNGARCTLCDNEGEITVKRKIRVNINSHVKDGARTKIPQMGKFGKNGGKNGDLCLIIKIKNEV